jgi:hypothetical protein
MIDKGSDRHTLGGVTCHPTFAALHHDHGCGNGLFKADPLRTARQAIAFAS